MTTERVQVHLLDDVRVVRDGDDFDPGGPVRTTVLAVLAAAAPDPVPHGRLIDAVWPDDPPGSARNSLQAHVSKLRRLLEPQRDAGDPSLIESVADGYRLSIDQLATDIGRFRDLVSAAVTVQDWREAVRVGQGAPLPGCVESWPVLAERRAFEEEHLDALGSWVEAELREGHPGEVIGELERLVQEHPLRERFWALLITALHAAGRRSDALETFQRARETLVETAGIEPGPELREAQRAVLTSDVVPTADSAGTSHVRRVPAPHTPLVGRAEEVRQVADLLRRWRLVTIGGPGGVGKTRVAIEAAAQPPDPVEQAVFVDLTSVRDETEVAPAVAAATGLRFVTARDDLEAVMVDRLRATPTLLVVDNAEHVLEPVARLVDLLLDEVESLVVLATSRRPLDVGGEKLFPLGPMALDDAITLLLERADARRRGVSETADRDVVRELCQALDRLPLAIEIAAGQAAHLSVGEILATTVERPDALRRPSSGDRGDRHRSLRSTIAWSYELLAPEAREVLRHLAVFRGPFDRGQVATVVPGDRSARAVADLLGDLVAHSLVVADPEPMGTTYRMLETIRAFAHAELERHGEATSAQERHRSWYVQWARARPAGTTLLDTASALSLQRHHGDLLAALEHVRASDDATALADLALLASGFAFCPGGLADAERWVRIALDRGDGIDDARRADLLTAGMYVAMLGDDREVGRERFSAVLPLVDEHPGGIGPLAVALGIADPTTVGAAAETAEDLLTRHGDELRDDVAHGIRTMRPMLTAGRTLDRERALVEAEEAWSGRAWSDRQTIATWSIHAALLHVTGRHRELEDRLAEMEPVPAALGPPTFFVTIFEALALAGTGDPDAAIDHVRRARERHWAGVPGVESDLLSAVAAIHDLAGDPDRAREILDRSGFRARHPGTAMVHVDHAMRLGLPVDDYISDWARGPDPHLSDLLDEVLAS